MVSDPSRLIPTADFGSRFSAFVIDAALLFVVQWVVVIVAARQLQAVGLSSTEQCADNPELMCQGPSTILWLLILAFLLASTVGYHAFFEGRYGSTPGKRWMGLQVVDASTLAAVGFLNALVRSGIRQAFWLLPFVLFEASPFGLPLPAALVIILPMLALLVFVRGAWHVDGQGLHDLAAGTLVVRRDPARQQVQPVTPHFQPSSKTIDDPAAGVPAAGVPVDGVPVAGVPVAGVPVAGVPVAGVPVAGVPVAGVCAADVPVDGVCSADVPAAADGEAIDLSIVSPN